MTDRNTLVDQPCYGKCIMLCGNNNDFLLPRLFHDPFIYFRASRYDHAAYAQIHSHLLYFLTVSQNDQILRLHKFCHQFPAGSYNPNFSIRHIAVRVPDDDLPSYSRCDVTVLRPRRSQYIAVIHIHIGSCDISDGDHTFQFTIPCHRKCFQVLFFHFCPCSLNRQWTIHPFHLPQYNVFYLYPQIRQKCRGFYVKIIQHILGLLV